MSNPTGPDTLTDAIFKASMNPAVQAVMNMPADPSGAPGPRQNAASALGAQTPPFPFAVVGWGWGADQFMQVCQTNDDTVYTAEGGAKVKVSTDAADYPPYAPSPVSPAPVPKPLPIYVGTPFGTAVDGSTEDQTWDAVPDGTYVSWSNAAGNGAPAGMYQKHRIVSQGPFGPWVSEWYEAVSASSVPPSAQVLQS